VNQAVVHNITSGTIVTASSAMLRAWLGLRYLARICVQQRASTAARPELCPMLKMISVAGHAPESELPPESLFSF
jgi:hypothetical protein